MFESLGERLEQVIKKIKGYGHITEANISDIVRDIRLSLLEADVDYQVVRDFTNKIKAKALGEEVKSSLKPGEVFVKILKEELTILLGENKVDLTVNDFTKVMLVGLQGSGKTTTIAKLAKFITAKYHKKPLLVACDVYRPAAIDQLQDLGKELTCAVYSDNSKDPVSIAKKALAYAKENKHDYLLFDTAGRLHIDEVLMEELININKEVVCDEILLVLDSMMGQDAINVIKGFSNHLPITGVILTKLDGDTRGGVALSVSYLTKLPIKFIGTGERLDGLAEFHPERMATRILGMGDILSIVEKTAAVIDQKETEAAVRRLQKGDFTLNDFLVQLKQIKKLGPLENIIKLLPGARNMGLHKVTVDPKQLMHIEAIILSMTKKERANPNIIKATRKLRIATGSGTKVEDINKLLKQFEQMKKVMKMMKSGNFNLPL